MLRGGQGHGAPCPRVRQCGGGRHGGLYQQPHGARGAPRQPAADPLRARRELHELLAQRQLHAAVARERLQYARRALSHQAAPGGGGLLYAAHPRERQVREVYALHPDLRERTDREDMGSARHRLPRDGGRLAQSPHPGYGMYLLRPVHHALPHGGAAGARRHGNRL